MEICDDTGTLISRLLKLWNSIQELNQTFMQIITGLDTGEWWKSL